MTTLLEKINSYIENRLDEKYSKEMVEIFPKDELKKLSRLLSNFVHIDIEKSTFSEVPVGSVSAGKMKNKVIICWYEKTKKFNVIENTDDGKTLGVVGGTSREYDKNKKQAIENADRLFVIDAINGVTNYDIRKLRRDQKDGADALNRNDPYYAANRDKSGYSIDPYKNALDDKLFARTKEKRIQAIMNRIKSICNDVTITLNKISDGKFKTIRGREMTELENKVKMLLAVVSKIGLYGGVEELTGPAVNTIENQLDKI